MSDILNDAEPTQLPRRETTHERFTQVRRPAFPRHAAHRQLQVQSYRVYLDRAKPAIRVSPATLQQLVRSFVLEGEFKDAEQLARALAASSALPEGWVDTMDLLINALLKSGRAQEAQAWLPVLEQRAPHDALTRRLAAHASA